MSLRPSIVALSFAVATLATTAGANERADLPPAAPPDAKVGECWAMVKTAPQYARREVSVELQPEKTVERRIAGESRWVEREVRVPAYTQRRVITPAVVEWVEETVTEPARTETRRVPGTYRTVLREEPIRTGDTAQWQRDITADGALCWVETPTAFRQVAQRQPLTPATTETVEIAERTHTKRRRVVKTPAVIDVTEVPAQVKIERIREEITPDRFVTETIPAVMGTEVRRVMVEPSRLDLRAVLCDTNATPTRVRAVQQALRTSGHYRGPLDGQFGAQTLAAMDAFQTAEGLATEGVTLEALAALGVE